MPRTTENSKINKVRKEIPSKMCYFTKLMLFNIYIYIYIYVCVCVYMYVYMFFCVCSCMCHC